MPFVNSLHLQYRLWIAEMNEDINVLRIFNDYLAELSKQDDKYDDQIETFKKRFEQSRNELDELKHELHLQKMKLGAIAKSDDTGINNIHEDIQHDAFVSRYESFSEQFNALKKEVTELEAD